MKNIKCIYTQSEAFQFTFLFDSEPVLLLGGAQGRILKDKGRDSTLSQLCGSVKAFISPREHVY